MNTDVLKLQIEVLKVQGFTDDEIIGCLADHGAGSSTKARETETVQEYVKMVRKGLTEGTLGGYDTHFKRFVDGIARQCDCECERCVAEFDQHGACSCECSGCSSSALEWPAAGSRPMRRGEFTRTEVQPIAEMARRMSAKRAMAQNRRRAERGLAPRPSHGQGGQEMCVTALRCLFECAVDDEILTTNPFGKVDKGDRSEPDRRALKDHELEQLLEVVVSGGNDPELDLLITWSELELAARRGGVLSLKVGQLKVESQAVNLLEKRNKMRTQPATEALVRALLAHAARRGGPRCVPGHPDYDPNAEVLYYRNSTPEKPHPLTKKRFDTLHERVQLALPWANEMRYSGHALRHTVATIIERVAGTQVAAQMLGHERKSTTDHYTGSDLGEVARVFGAITGSSHPAASE